MWWNDGNGTWFCQAPRKAPCSPAAWPATAATATTAGHLSALEHRSPPPARPTSPSLNSQRAGGREPRRICTQVEMGMEKHSGASLSSVSTSPTQDGVPYPRSSLDANQRATARSELRNHSRIFFHSKGTRCTLGVWPIASWKGPCPRSFSEVAADPKGNSYYLRPLPPTLLVFTHLK